jgi:TPR repeat protein
MLLNYKQCYNNYLLNNKWNIMADAVLARSNSVAAVSQTGTLSTEATSAAVVVSPPHEPVIVVISDVHGCLDSAKTTLRRLKVIDDKNQWCMKAYMTLVVLGDWIDRGPDSVGAYDFFATLQNQAVQANAGIVIRVAGNHELEHLRSPTETERFVSHFVKEGGTPYDSQKIKERLHEDIASRKVQAAAFLRGILFSHGAFLPTLQRCLITEIYREKCCDSVTFQEIVDHMNQLLVDGATHSKMIDRHPLFCCDRIGSNQSGSFWADLIELNRFKESVGCQVMGHSTQANNQFCIYIDRDGRFACADPGFPQKRFGALKIKGNQLIAYSAPCKTKPSLSKSDWEKKKVPLSGLIDPSYRYLSNEDAEEKSLRQAASTNDPTALVRLGDFLIENFNKKEAIQCYEQAARLGNTTALVHLGDIKLEIKRTDDAIDYYRQAAEKDDWFGLQKLCTQLLANPDLKEVEKWCTIAAQKGMLTIPRQAGDLFLKSKDKQRAINFFRMAAEYDTIALQKLCVELLEPLLDINLDETEKWCRKVVAINPACLLEFARQLSIIAPKNNYPKIKECYCLVAEAGKDTPIGDQAIANLFEFSSRFELFDLAHDLAYFRKAAEDPQIPICSSPLNIGFSLGRMHRLDEAMRYFQELTTWVVTDEIKMTAFQEMATIAKNQKDIPLAITYYKEAAKLGHPDAGRWAQALEKKVASP